MNWRRCYLHSNSTNQTHNQLTSHSTSSYVLVSKMTTVLWTQLHCTMVVICFEFLSTSPICAAQVCVHTYSILKFGAYQSAGEWYISFVCGYEYYLWVYSFVFKQFVVLYKVCVFRVLLIFLECIDINTIMYTDHHSSWAKMICIHKACSKL